MTVRVIPQDGKKQQKKAFLIVKGQRRTDELLNQIIPSRSLEIAEIDDAENACSSKIFLGLWGR
jgi:hypothetical protein